jgi:hypothetical protein
VHLEVLKVDGGVAANDLCMHLQVDTLGVPVSRPLVAETTVLGPLRGRPGHRILAEHRRGQGQLERIPALDPKWNDRQRPTGSRAGRML